MKRFAVWGVAAVAAVVALGLAWWTVRPGEAEPAAEFVGAAACASCHQAEFSAWQGSQHDLAMQEATPTSVLGDFQDGSLSYNGVTTTFFRRDGTYYARTDAADGVLRDFEIRYTYGVDPLQQYLIELPDGRIQPLSIAWDSRPAEEGGQRWFHLYPGESVTHGDELHWTSRGQNWNFTCADCHSTNVRKGYDAGTDSFRTTWSEIDVGCEACHGPASEHLAWADAPGILRALAWRGNGVPAPLAERRGVSWTVDAATGQPRRSEPRTTEAEISACVQCHSRRAQIGEGYRAGGSPYDHYVPSLLMPGLYHADGQQRDEVYTHGSFLQSRMFAAGVTCSDCHDPHSQELRAPGNQLCAQCHTPARYDDPAHHFHPGGSSGAECVSCHMPADTYMVVDPRRDHSIRVPRPDQSVALGVPNACTDCHTDQEAEWAAERVRDWYGRDAVGFQRFAEAFHADETGAPGAAEALATVAGDGAQPAFVRASAVARLAGRTGSIPLQSASAALRDADPSVRRAAVLVLEELPPRDRISLLTPLLDDPTRAVRIQVAWALAPVQSGLSGEEAQASFQRAAAEFVESQRYTADRPESRTTLGSFFARLGRVPEAIAEYQAALRLDPRGVPAYVNLADLYRSRGVEPEAERTLREGLAVNPDDPTLHHALGLSLARSGRVGDAVTALGRAAALAPESPVFAYAHGVALHSTGESDAAIRALESALERHPNDRDLRFALSTFHRDAGRPDEALRHAEILARDHPDDAEAQGLVGALR